MHIEVVDRDLESPGLLEALGRNITKLVGTTSLALAVGLAIPYGSHQGGILGVVVGSAIIMGGVLAVLATGWVGLGILSSTPRRRRLGDLMVGTQVIRSVKQVRLVAPLPMPSPLPPVRA